jgi:hypothetical protein
VCITENLVVWFLDPLGHWHQWSTHEDYEDAERIGFYLIEQKGVRDVMLAVEGEHPDNQIFVLREFEDD